MPCYEYRCPHCDHEIELLRPMDERDEPIECPQCKNPEMTRKVSLTSFVLKGGGWASDGYAG